MEIPLQITGRDLELTEAIEAEIRKRAEKLDKFYDRIVRCRVVAESPHRRHQQGKLYNIQIQITVPGAEIVVKREPNEDLYVAIRDSFNAARRKLEDYRRKQRGDVKQHDVPEARITSLFPDEGYGFITTPDNVQIYFHENSVINHEFRDLEVGMRVRFEETDGEKGPQASTVAVL